MTILLTIVHIFVCFFLVIVVLLQSGKAADLAGAFGGMGSQTAFGHADRPPSFRKRLPSPPGCSW